MHRTTIVGEARWSPPDGSVPYAGATTWAACSSPANSGKVSTQVVPLVAWTSTRPNTCSISRRTRPSPCRLLSPVVT